MLDAAKGNNQTSAWLKDGVALSAEPELIAIDMNIYVLNKKGEIYTYYKGDKTGELRTNIPVDNKSLILTTKDSLYIFLLNKNMGRIYMINKGSGEITKTLKLNNQEPFLSAAISRDESIYLLDKSNKIWKASTK